MKDQETLFLVAFFKFTDEKRDNFKRIHLHGLYKTEEEARKISFCDEAGWYEGILIEERGYGQDSVILKRGKRIWILQKEGGELYEIEEPKSWNCIVGLIG